MTVDVEKPRMQEVWDKNFSRWEEVAVDEIQVMGAKANITTRDGDVLLNVPKDAFVELQQQKKRITL